MSIKNIALEYLKSEEHDVKIYNQVLEALKPFDGVLLTYREHKKIVKDLELLGFIDVNLSLKYSSWYEISFHVKDTPENTNQGRHRAKNGFRFQLQYVSQRDKDGKFLLQHFIECNTWANRGAPHRIDEVKKFLKSKKPENIEKAFNMILEAQKILEKSDFKNSTLSNEILSFYGVKIESVKE